MSMGYSYLTCACPQITRPRPLCSFTCRSVLAGWTQTSMTTEKFAWACWGPGPGVEARSGRQSRTFYKFWFQYKVFFLNNACLDHLLELICHDVVKWGCWPQCQFFFRVFFLLYFTRKFDLRLSTFLFLLFLAYLDGPGGKGYLVFVFVEHTGRQI